MKYDPTEKTASHPYLRVLIAALLVLLLVTDVTPAFAEDGEKAGPSAVEVTAEGETFRPAEDEAGADMSAAGENAGPEDAAGKDIAQAEEPGADSEEIQPEWTPEDGLPAVKSLKVTVLNSSQILVNWASNECFEGYQVQYARNVLFLSAKKAAVKGTDVNNLTLSGLKTSKRWYVRIRGYRKYEGQKYYGDWIWKKTKKPAADVSIRFMKSGGRKADIRRQAGKRLKKYDIAQGACSDGKFLYMAFEYRRGDSNGSGKARIKIAKVRISNWKLVKVSPSGQKLGHANDITYNPDRKILVVTGAKKKDPYVRLVSPKTLKKTGTKKVRLTRKYKDVKAFNGIDYDRANHCYYIRSRLCGGKSFTLDQNFKMLDASVIYTVFPTRHVQGVITSGDNVLIPQSWYQSSGKNTLTIFTRSGAALQTVKIKVTGELESIFFIGKKLYATVHKKFKGTKKAYIFQVLL